ncbi:MAG: translation initiation factor IF-2 [Candidatus Kaelpia aquatica]|nr:translation initiation factor IF-2 [Candidatus Kaelpia aquatica]
MSSTRVYILAQELGLDSKELMEYLKDLNVDAKSHMSNLDLDTAELVRSEVTSILNKKKKAELDKNPKIAVEFPITVRDLAVKLGAKPNEVQKKLLQWKVFASINQPLKEDIALRLAEEFGFALKRQLTHEEEVVKTHKDEEDGSLKSRHPIVTLMGHVDHGKTTLLEKIRDLELTHKEAGGITQHIGAYEVVHKDKKITFIDTPGHEAFTSMRARGANVTDIVILVVAADDGVMPQTVEAINHAKAADVPIIVAINKVDRPEANIDKVKRELAEIGLASEDWGGDVIAVNVSALAGEGIDALLDMVILQAEIMELKSNPNKLAKGVVLESKITKGGPFVSVIVQSGTLKAGDMFISGTCFGKVRALFNDIGLEIRSIGPSDPAGILGLNGVPESGEGFLVVEDESKIKGIIGNRKNDAREKKQAPSQRMSLQDLTKEGQKLLRVILKADVYGSLDAVVDSLEKLKNSQKEELDIKILHKGVGNITESDVVLALASDAFVVGFNVGIDDKAKARAKKEAVEVRLYSIIYELIEDIDKVFKGLQEPELEERLLGRVEVRKVFDVSKVGKIAGCWVSKGKIQRNSPCRLLRGKKVAYEGRITSLKRFKDDTKEVSEGYECGLRLEGHNDITEGDIIEAYTMIEV